MAVEMATMKLRAAHIRIVLIASLGQFLGQGLATLVGIVIPLLELASPSALSPTLQGIVGCISLIGIMIGSAVIGNLCDRMGYVALFRLCPATCGAAALAVILFPHVGVLTAALFVMGFAIGGEYSLDPNYISELMPDRWKVFMVGVAKAVAAAGSAFIGLICYVVLRHGAGAQAWPSLMWIVVGLCAVMFVSRLGFAQSPQWLADRHQKQAAERAVRKMLGQDVAADFSTAGEPAAQSRPTTIGRFVASHLGKVVLTGIPWACEGLGVYGIGIFLPILIMAFGIDPRAAGATPIEQITHSVETTFILCVVMMVGFIIGLSILHRVNHIRMQIVGFGLSVVGLSLLLAAYMLRWPAWTSIGAFMIFELALNAGPHLITFVLPSQVFASTDRGTGAGLAASIGKSGAVAGAFFIPVILHHLGAEGVLGVSIAVMGLGGLVTWLFRRYAASPQKSSAENPQDSTQ